MENTQISDITTTQNVVVNSGANVAKTTVADNSVFDYFWSAGLLIKLVMLALLFSSIWSWTVIITKYLKLKRLKADADYFEESFWSGTPLEDLYKEIKGAIFDPMSNVFCSAMAEWENFASGHKKEEVSATKTLERRVDRAMQIAIRREVDDLEKGMAFCHHLARMASLSGFLARSLEFLMDLRSLLFNKAQALLQ